MSEENSPKKKVIILEEKEKTILVQSPPNLNSNFSFKIYIDKTGILIRENKKLNE